MCVFKEPVYLFDLQILAIFKNVFWPRYCTTAIYNSYYSIRIFFA